MGWTVLVLIPKGTTDTRVIGLLDTLWKVVEELIETRLRASLQFHDVLHGFLATIGTGTAIMDLDLAQYLAIVDQDPLFMFFLGLWKSYNTVDRERLIQTLEGYGARPRMCGFLETVWYHQQVVLTHNGCHSLAFLATQGTTHGGLVSPTLFNVVVDNVI